MTEKSANEGKADEAAWTAQKLTEVAIRSIKVNDDILPKGSK